VHPTLLVDSPGPMGTITPSSSFTALFGFGAVLPRPTVECFPGGRLLA